MKLQYLGDYRDAFKWDLLHWLCSDSRGERTSLVFVPLLTPDDPNPRDGQVPHTRFRARPELQRFVAGLRGHVRGLDAIVGLGTLDPEKPFPVTIHAPNRFIAAGRDRSDYWIDLELPPNTILFLDPDNGFETTTCKGAKWVRHAEVRSLLDRLPHSSAIVIYQHRPHRRWDNVFEDLTQNLTYAGHVSATFDSNLAFIIVGSAAAGPRRLSEAARLYAASHPLVSYRQLIGGSQ